MSAAKHTVYYDRDFLRLLAFSPFERRRGGWRFGTKMISDRIIARLIASGAARIEGDFVFARAAEAARNCESSHSAASPARALDGGCISQGDASAVDFSL